MNKKATVAIPLILSMLLSACGGGGGSDTPAPAPAPAPSPAPAPAPAPAPSPAPAPAPTGIIQAGAFAPFGPETLAASSVGDASFSPLTSTARLTGGGSVVAWTDGTSVVFQRLDVDGNAVGPAPTVGAVLGVVPSAGAITGMSAVATADGGWLIAWTSPDKRVMFRRYDASGAPVADAAPVDATAFAKVVNIQARALADGGFVVAWVAAEGTGTSRAFVRRFSAAGAATTDRLGVSASAGAQTFVQIAPMPDGNFLAAWAQTNTDGTYSLLARRLDASLAPSGPEQVVGAPSIPSVYEHLGAATLSQGSVLLAWADSMHSPPTIHWQLLDGLGSPTLPGTAGNSFALETGWFVHSLEVVPSASGFRIFTESAPALKPSSVRTNEVDVGASGALAGSTQTSRVVTESDVSGGGCAGPLTPGVAAAGGEDGHYVLAYAICGRRASGSEPWPPSKVEVLGR